MILNYCSFSLFLRTTKYTVRYLFLFEERKKKNWFHCKKRTFFAEFHSILLKIIFFSQKYINKRQETDSETEICYAVQQWGSVEWDS
jgi:hypothetical protein